MVGGVSKRKGLLITVIVLCVVCLGQFVYILGDIAGDRSEKPSPAYVTDPRKLIESLVLPTGIEPSGSKEIRHSFTWDGKGNFDGCFWLELSDEDFSDKRVAGDREALISGTARVLARQIADRIPGGYVNRDCPGSEAFNLSGTTIVTYPGGWVVVNAAYMNSQRYAAGRVRERPADAEFEMIKVWVHGFGEKG